jgi:SAM-dependent methyltransferase
MDEHETLEQNRRSWDIISAPYQAHTRISTTDVHYGPLAPGERELGLLGDVRARRILEIGCGGGQNAIALARWGATCVGIDPSAAQLAHARQLARQHGVDVQFVNGIAEDLSAFPDGSFDIVLSSYAFGYVTDLQRAYREVWRVLPDPGSGQGPGQDSGRRPDLVSGEPGGLFVFCLSHPWFQAVGWHLAGDPDAPEVGNYAAWPGIEEWDWSFEDGTSAPMRGHLHTLAQVVNGLIGAGFTLERVVEQNYEDVAQASLQELARFPYVPEFDHNSREYEIARKLPLTLLIRARKGGTVHG